MWFGKKIVPERCFASHLKNVSGLLLSVRQVGTFAICIFSLQFHGLFVEMRRSFVRGNPHSKHDDPLKNSIKEQKVTLSKKNFQIIHKRKGAFWYYESKPTESICTKDSFHVCYPPLKSLLRSKQPTIQSRGQKNPRIIICSSKAPYVYGTLCLCQI